MLTRTFHAYPRRVDCKYCSFLCIVFCLSQVGMEVARNATHGLRLTQKSVPTTHSALIDIAKQTLIQ
jgi:hypothetical protein